MNRLSLRTTPDPRRPASWRPISLLALVLFLSGCAAAQPAFIWPWWRKGTAPIPRDPWPTAAQEAELSNSANTWRAGSTALQARPGHEARLANSPPGNQAMPLPLADHGAANAEAMTEVLRELQSLEHLTPEQQERLLASLKGREPAAWPQLVRSFRDTLPRTPAPAPPGGAALVTHNAPQAVPAQIAPAPSMVQPDDAPRGVITGIHAVPAPPAQIENLGENPVVPASATTPLPTMGPPAAPSSASQPALPAAPQPLPADATNNAAPGDWRFHLAAAIGALEAHAATQADAALAADGYARLRLLYLAAGRREEALRSLASLAADQQEFWSRELTGLATYLDGAANPDPLQRAADAIAHFDAAQRNLRNAAPLEVRNPAFCTEVNSYGVYQPFPTTEFAPGQEVLLYAEIENQKSEQRPDGFYTALDSSYELVDAAGKVVETRSFGPTVETCRNERRDFFIRYQFFLPQELAPGAYTLNLKIQDALAQKTGQTSITLSIKTK